MQAKNNALTYQFSLMFQNKFNNENDVFEQSIYKHIHIYIYHQLKQHKESYKYDYYYYNVLIKKP